MISICEIHQDNGVDGYEEKKNQNTEKYHLSLMTYGKCVYWINDQKIIMEKGDVILIPGGNHYYVKSIPTVFHSKYVINFLKSTELINLPIIDSTEYVKVKIGCYDLILERLKIIYNQWTERLPYYDIMLSALLTEVLIYINREMDRGMISSEKFRYVELMRNYIQKHYRSKITKEELGDAIRKSPNYTAALFSTITGQTISEYVHSARTKTAIYMLTESQLTIGEISEYLGYSDVSYFHRVFKRITGNFPSDYLGERKRL